MESTSIEMGKGLMKLFHYDFEKDTYVPILKFERYSNKGLTGYIVWYE